VLVLLPMWRFKRGIFLLKGQLLLEKRVQNLFAKFPRKSLYRQDIAEMLNLHGGERKQLTGILRKLVASGEIGHKKGLYRLRQGRKSVQGLFTKLDQGFGFVCPEEAGQEDLFISARNTKAALTGDLVIAQHSGLDRSGRPYGRVIKILQRAQQTVLGIFQQQRGNAWVVPFDTTIGRTIFVQREGSLMAESGQVVKLELVRYPTATAAGSGVIVEVLGDQDDPQVDIETVICEQNLPRHFSAEALSEAEQVALNIPAEELPDRTDLRSLPLMTIDGETAKDFDDAVSVRKESGGNYRLWVSIADVAHYVDESGALDLDARERGTSVYFPGFCLPMLPELLSNGICSLNPGEDRLAMTAEMLFSPEGRCVKSRFYPAVISSQARLTYTEVAAFLEGASTRSIDSRVTDQLPIMAELAEVLARMRRERGSLELDVPDIEIVLDKSGFPAGVVKAERTIAHRLIEEFMLAANEAVAAFLTKQNYPFLYRIHETPTIEKLQDFQQLAAECGVGLVLGKNLQQQLQQLLEEIADKPEARLLNQQLLRSLQQARYTPENKGHFGLAADCYCHFTSPIRRYPDLTVHRVLKQALQKKRQELASASPALVELGRDCSEKERRAMAAERQLFELRRCQLLQERVGEFFSGMITSVAEFGFFVEIDDLCIEGLVHVRSLVGDYYSFDPQTHSLQGERRRKQYRVGMRVDIRVQQVEIRRRRIDFVLADQG